MKELNKKIMVTLVMILSINFYYSQNYYEEGYREYFKGDRPKSIELFTKSIESNENLANSYMMRGAAKGSLNEMHNALSDLNESFKIDSSNFKLYFYYGRIYFLNEFYSIAIKYYNTAINKNLKDADSYDDRAMCKMKIGDFSGAVKDEDVAIKLDSNNSIYYLNRGSAKSLLKNYEDAIKDFNYSLNIESDPIAYYNRGVAFFYTGKYSNATDDLTKAIIKMPNTGELFYYRGLSYILLGKLTEACLDFSKSVKLNYIPSVLEQKKYCIN